MDQVGKDEFEEILERMEDRMLMERCLKSEDWRWFHKACKHVAQLAKEQLLVVNPDDKTKVLSLQLQAQFYEDVLPGIINRIKVEGEQAYENAKEQGLLSKVLSYFKSI